MPVIKIDPIKVKVANGHTATLTGINPGSTDPIIGHVALTTGETFQGRWDLGGLARDNDGSMNLVITSLDDTEWADLVDYAKSQLLPSIRQLIGK